MLRLNRNLNGLIAGTNLKSDAIQFPGDFVVVLKEVLGGTFFHSTLKLCVTECQVNIEMAEEILAELCTIRNWLLLKRLLFMLNCKMGTLRYHTHN